MLGGSQLPTKPAEPTGAPRRRGKSKATWSCLTSSSIINVACEAELPEGPADMRMGIENKYKVLIGDVLLNWPIHVEDRDHLYIR